MHYKLDIFCADPWHEESFKNSTKQILCKFIQYWCIANISILFKCIVFKI